MTNGNESLNSSTDQPGEDDAAPASGPAFFPPPLPTDSPPPLPADVPPAVPTQVTSALPPSGPGAATSPDPVSPRTRGTVRAGLIGGLVGAVVAGGVAFGTVRLSDGNHSSAATPPAAAALANPSALAADFDVHGVLDKVGNAVVAIEVGTQRGNGIFNDGAGSGFIISDTGYVITNNHVVNGADAITVKFADGKTEDATVVGTSSQHDIAVVKIKDIHGATPLKLADTTNLRVGDAVLAIGNALDLGNSPTVTLGIVSAKGRTIDTQSRTGAAEHLTGLIQTDAAINPGNSGGPLVNAAGEVVGINSAGVPGANNIGFAIDINRVKDVITQLEQGKDVEASAPFLGVVSVSVSDLDQPTRQQFNVTVDAGVLIETVQPGSAADKAGLKSGDVVVKVDGKGVTSSDQLRMAIQAKKPGDTMALDIKRGDQSQTINVTLGSRRAQNS